MIRISWVRRSGKLRRSSGRMGLYAKQFQQIKDWGAGIIQSLGAIFGFDAIYFAKNSFWVSFKNGVGMVTGFFLSIAFARFVSKEVFGQYTFILSTVYLVNFLSIPKFDFALSQSAARGYDQSLFQATKVSFGGSLVAALVLLGVAGRYFALGDPNLGYGFIFAAVFFPILFGLKTYDHFLIGKKRFDLSAKFAALSSVLTGIVLISAMALGHGVVGVILSYLVVNGGMNLWYFWQTRKLVGNKRHDPEVVRYGVYLTLLALTSMVVARLGSALLNHFHGAAVLATYSIAIIIPKAIQNLMQNLVDVAKVKVADRGRKELLTTLKRHWLKWVGLGVITAGFLWVGLPILIPLIYSDKYNDAIRFAQVASLSLIFWPINTFIGTLVLLEKKRKIIALSNFLPSVPNIVLLPVAISLYGIWGVIGVNLLSWLYLTPFQLWAFLRKKDL